MNNNYLIVVGVDGSEGGRRALDWAAREAATRGGAGQAVIAWSWDGMEFGPVPATRPDEESERAAQVLQQEVNALAERRGSAFPVATEVIGRPELGIVWRARLGHFVHAAWDTICDTLHTRLADPMRAACRNLTEWPIDGGHGLMLERPDQVNTALAQWLESVTR